VDSAGESATGPGCNIPPGPTAPHADCSDLSGVVDYDRAVLLAGIRGTPRPVSESSTVSTRSTAWQLRDLPLGFHGWAIGSLCEGKGRGRIADFSAHRSPNSEGTSHTDVGLI